MEDVGRVSLMETKTSYKKIITRTLNVMFCKQLFITLYTHNELIKFEQSNNTLGRVMICDSHVNC